MGILNLKEIKKSSGITLIALVVTVIILIILAGVSISVLFGSNGIITRAREGAENYKQAEQDEKEILELLADEMSLESPKYMAYEDNVYKQYSNGNVYGIGKTGYMLNSTYNEVNTNVWQEFKSPISNTKEIISGYASSMFIIDSDDYLWAWGSNPNNLLGLTGENITATSVLNPTKVGEKTDGTFIKVSRVFPGNYKTYVIEKDTNKIYVMGDNTKIGGIGVGNENALTVWTEVQFTGDVSSKTVKTIKSFGMSNGQGTLIWFTDNTFYYTGTNEFGNLGLGTDEKRSVWNTKFVQIWNNEGYWILDQDIKDVLIGASTMVLSTDGTIMQAGYTREAGSGGGASLVSGNQFAFRKFTTFEDNTIDSIYQVTSGRVVKLKNGEIWASAGTTNRAGLEEEKTNTTEYYQISNVPNNIKEIVTTMDNVYYILNNGDVYASGEPSGMGAGDQNRVYTIEKLNISNIKNVYNAQILDGYSRNFILLEGNNGKLYITGQANFMSGGSSIESNWTKVASDVKDFAGWSYIDNNGDLWVAGTNSLYLGLGETTGRYIYNFVENTTTGLKGNSEKIRIGSEGHNPISAAFAVVTKDKKLYVTGRNNYGQLGRGNTSAYETDFREVLQDKNIVQVSSTNMSIIALAEDGKLYGSGGSHTRPLTLPEGITEFTEITAWDPSNKIKQLYSGANVTYILTEAGEIYRGGNETAENSGIINPNISQFMKMNIGNNNFIKISGKSYTQYGITSTGEVWKFGNVAPTKINIPTTEKIVDVASANGFTIYITETGKVYGEGSNVYGVLGVWTDEETGEKANGPFVSASKIVRCGY